MSALIVEGLRASAAGSDVLKGIDLEVHPGEVHAVMGPNGSGKSTLAHVLLGKPGYEVVAGSVTLDGIDLLALAPHERAAAGLFGTLQYPIEVPGVALADVLGAALEALGRSDEDLWTAMTREANRIGYDESLLSRSLNVDSSGGERKRTETLQLAVLQPRYAVLDELDSGLDIDALRVVSTRIEAGTEEFGLGVLAITHYTRLLSVLRADRVHVLVGGVIVESGGAELAAQLEAGGYTSYTGVPDSEGGRGGDGR